MQIADSSSPTRFDHRLYARPRKRAARFGAVFLSILAMVVAAWLPRYGLDEIPLIALFLPLSLALLVGQAIFGSITRKDYLQHLDSTLPFLIAVVGLISINIMLSSLVAEDPFRVSRLLFGYVFALSILLLVLPAVQSSNRILTVINLLIALAVISSVLAFISYYVPPLKRAMLPVTREHLDPSQVDRVAGFFKHPNQFGIILATILPLSVAANVQKPRNLIRWVASASILMGIVMSGSKANLVFTVFTVAACAVFSSMIARRRSIKWLRIAVSGLCIAAVLPIGYLVTETYNPRAIKRLEDFFLDTGRAAPSMLVRERIWDASIAQGAAHPLTGTGAGSNILQYTHSHNVFLDHFRSLGVPGLLLLVLIIAVLGLLSLRIIRRALREEQGSRDVRAALVGTVFGIWAYILGNQTSDSFGASTVSFFWLLIALAYCQDRLLRRERLQRRNESRSV